MEERYCSRLMIVNEKEELLLFQYKDEHRSEPFWATAGGELKEGETYLDAASRKLYEET
ncbi:NUDIX domain-containing protein [Agaribacter flavus]|uniref:NUDIX domain-containing protein n=1 Tax=Agaribacter flavus TaxID=1902781 RepID=A0ABV7FQ22_9ALTE